MLAQPRGLLDSISLLQPLLSELSQRLGGPGLGELSQCLGGPGLGVCTVCVSGGLL